MPDMPFNPGRLWRPMRVKEFAALFIMLLFLAVPCHGKDISSSQQDTQSPVHLAILDAHNNTGDVFLDWLPRGALELITYSMSYMRGIVLVPIEKAIISDRFPILKHLGALEIYNGLSVSLEGNVANLTLTIRTQDLLTGREQHMLSLSGSQGYILSRLPEAVSGIANSIGYTPDEQELRWAMTPATTSPLAWRHYTEAIYGPEQNTLPKLEAALRADPGFSEAISRLAMIHIEENRQEQAVAEIGKALRIKPFLHTALYSMSRLYYNKGDRGNTSKYLSKVMEINPRNRFLYDSRNIDSVRNFHQRTDYGFFGPKAALLDLQSPVHLDGSFGYLSRYKSYSGQLRGNLNSPNTAVRLISMKWHKMAGLKSHDDSLWHLMGSENIIQRALALEMFSKAGGKSGCQQAINSIASPKNKSAPSAFEYATESLRYSIIHETARAVGRICDASSESNVRKLLKSDNEETRLIGACLLGLFGSRDEIEGILEANTRRNLSMLASESLARIATEKDIKEIYDIVDKVPSSYVPLAIIAASDSQAASEAMANAIAHTDRSIRLSAVQALGHSHSSYAGGPLLSALSDSDKEVRISAANSFKQLNMISPAIEGLKEMLSNGEKESIAALEALASSNDKDAIKAVIDAAGNERIPPMNRAMAILELKGVKPDNIRHLVSHKEGAIRASSLRRLAEVDAEGLREHLKEALSGNHKEPKVAALEIISGINMEIMEGEETGLLNGTVSEIHIDTTIASTQGIIDDMDMLKGALADDDPEVKVAAARALGSTHNTDSITALALSLYDKESSVRVEAARALGMIKVRESDKILKTLLKDHDPEVKIAAMISMAQHGDRRSIDSLADVAASSGHYVNAIVNASSLLQDRALSIYLLGALTMPGNDQRTRIYDAMFKIGANDEAYRHLAATGDRKAFQAMRTGDNFKGGNLSILTEDHDDYARGAGYYLMAMRARAAGDMTEMHRLAGKAYKYSKGSGRGGFTVASLILKADAELALDKPKAAISTLRKTGKWLRRTNIKEHTKLYGDLEMTARIPLMLAQATHAKGDINGAVTYYREALSKAELNRIITNSSNKAGSLVVLEALKGLRAIMPVNHISK